MTYLSRVCCPRPPMDRWWGISLGRLPSEYLIEYIERETKHGMLRNLRRARRRTESQVERIDPWYETFPLLDEIWNLGHRRERFHWIVPPRICTQFHSWHLPNGFLKEKGRPLTEMTQSKISIVGGVFFAMLHWEVFLEWRWSFELEAVITYIPTAG